MNKGLLKWDLRLTDRFSKTSRTSPQWVLGSFCQISISVRQLCLRRYRDEGPLVLSGVLTEEVMNRRPNSDSSPADPQRVFDPRKLRKRNMETPNREIEFFSGKETAWKTESEPKSLGTTCP